jgi:hypothetical protein
LAIVSDDFSGYANTAALMRNLVSSVTPGTGTRGSTKYTDGYGAQLASIDNTVLYNGHPTLKLSQPAGSNTSASLSAGFPAPLTHIWYRGKIRFSPGYTTTGSSASSNAYKLLAWGWNSPDGSGRIEITNTTQYELYETVLSRSTGATVGGGNILTAGNITTEWTDGGWYDYIVEVDHSTANGVIRLWRAADGATPVYQGQAVEKMTDGSLLPALANISVGLNFNQIRTRDQAVWWGAWEVVDGIAHPNPFNVVAQ